MTARNVLASVDMAKRTADVRAFADWPLVAGDAVRVHPAGMRSCTSDG